MLIISRTVTATIYLYLIGTESAREDRCDQAISTIVIVQDFLNLKSTPEQVKKLLERIKLLKLETCVLSRSV